MFPASTLLQGHRAARLAWWAACLIALFLLAGLGLATASSAAGAAADPGATIAASPSEEEEVEECGADEPDCAEVLDGEECESDEEEEVEECEEAEDDGDAPSECLLTSARPQITISDSQRRLRLSVRYTLEAPAEVAVSLRSSGGRGGLAIAAEKRRLARNGSFQDTTALDGSEMERALAASRFTVRLRVIGVPWSCHRYDFRQLTVKRQAHGGAVFSESLADLRAGH